MIKANTQSRHGHRRGVGHRPGDGPGPAWTRATRSCWPAAGAEALEQTVAAAGTAARRALAVSRRRERPRSVSAPLRDDEGGLRPPRPAVQQRRHRRPGRPAGGPDVRAVAAGRRRQPDRRVPLHPGGVPADEGAGPARRPDHQQRLDLGPRAPAELRALHGHQARDHRPDQVDRPRRPEVRHRLRPDRHRQRRDRDDRPDEGRRAAGRAARSPSSRRWTSSTWPGPWSTWPACPWTPTSCS